jgi:hypothetical protein
MTTPREIAAKAFPWRVASTFQSSDIYRRMCDHIEYMATGGHGMDGDQLTKLAEFYEHLDINNVVVEYDPENGFAYRERTPFDRKLIIRNNEHATVTDARLLRFPPRMPEGKQS